MRLKAYSHEEIGENINDIVLLSIFSSTGKYEIKVPEICKVTQKQFKTSNLGGRTVRFADIGYLTYNSGFFLRKDIDYVIGVYRQKSIDELRNKIKQAEKEIEKLNNLTREK